MMPDIEKLRSIKSFPSLVKYLRDELEWPIESDDFDELVFDYEPDELGIEPKQIKPFPPFGIGTRAVAGETVDNGHITLRFF